MNRPPLLLLLALISFLDPKPSIPAPPPPNICFIMADDLGKEWVGCYGGEKISTPNIDRLASTGLRFDNAWCMPQCTPTRATLLTGTYPFRHGWVNHWDVPRWGSGCHFDPRHNMTFARLLQKAGYATCIAGKWQINDFRVQPNVLNQHGFDEYCVWTGYETGQPPSAERYRDPYLHTKDGSRTWPGRFGDEVFTEFIIDFMKRHREKPMLIYFPMCLTHSPLTSTPDEPEVKGNLEKHQAMVRYTDTLVGRLVKALDELGLRQNTILIWTSDNGTAQGIQGGINGRTISGGKGQTGENGVCMPFIVNGPGIVPQGVVTDALMDFTDLLPTFAELAGARVPPDLKIDGTSFAPLLTGRAQESTRRWIMAMGGQPAKFDPATGRVKPAHPYRDRVLRDKRYKLYIDTNRRPVKLIDLQRDPAEQTNLISAPDKAAQAALETLAKAAQQFPEQDAWPQYDPLPPQPWDKYQR